jgi:predicted nucleic acid-binding protein
VFVLDKDVLSELRRRRPNRTLLRWLAAVEWRELATTAITIMEIRFGIEMARRADPGVAAAVEQWLEGLLEVGGPQILPLDAPAAQILGRMYAVPALRRFFTTSPAARQAKTGADLAIAAIAISRQAVIATNNIADFQAIHRHFALAGLFNPLTGKWHIPRAGAAEAGG